MAAGPLKTVDLIHDVLFDSERSDRLQVNRGISTWQSKAGKSLLAANAAPLHVDDRITSRKLRHKAKPGPRFRVNQWRDIAQPCYRSCRHSRQSLRVARIRRARIETVHEIAAPSGTPSQIGWRGVGCTRSPSICGIPAAVIRVCPADQTSAPPGIRFAGVPAPPSPGTLRHCASTTSACHTPRTGLCAAACSTGSRPIRALTYLCRRRHPAPGSTMPGSHHVFGAGRDHHVEPAASRHAASPATRSAAAHAVIHNGRFWFDHHFAGCRVAIHQRSYEAPKPGPGPEMFQNPSNHLEVAFTRSPGRWNHARGARVNLQGHLQGTGKRLNTVSA
jgi:hypothetical protein